MGLSLAEKMRRLGILSKAQSEAVAKQRIEQVPLDISASSATPDATAPTSPAPIRVEASGPDAAPSFMGRPLQTQRGHHPEDVVSRVMAEAANTKTSWRRPKPAGLVTAETGAESPSVQAGAKKGVERAVERAPQPQFCSEVPGEEISNEFGSCILRVTRIPETSMHGQQTVGATRGLDPSLSAIAGRLTDVEGISPERRLYFDTETTSLSGGAGVFVFMVGLGRFEAGEFVVYQYFMRHPGEEAALWEALKPLLAEAECLVSFCGKSFDVPRCRDRGLYLGDHALGEHFDRLEHLDLFATARRLFRHRLTSGKLRAHEDELLGFQRQGDLPGSECPDAWFNYVRELDNRSDEIFEHNLWDIVSLATLEARVQQEMQQSQDVEAALAAAHSYFLAGDADGFALHLQTAADKSFAFCPSREKVPSPVPRALTVASILRSQKEFDLADRLLAAISHHDPVDPRPLIQRAMIAEHQLNDPQRAVQFVARALRHETLSSRWREALQHRARRLARATAVTKPNSVSPCSSA